MTQRVNYVDVLNAALASRLGMSKPKAAAQLVNLVDELYLLPYKQEKVVNEPITRAFNRMKTGAEPTETVEKTLEEPKPTETAEKLEAPKPRRKS